MHIEQLHSFLQSLEPAAYLVEPRVLRRVIRLDRRLPGFRLTIPHDINYTIDRDRLLAFVDLSELAVPPASDLPRRVILLPQPDEIELVDDADQTGLTDRYRRLLLHACVHLELESHLNRGVSVDAWATTRREQIGAVEFAEIREVLLKEDLLFQPPTDAEIYIEFAAVALELRCLAPQDLPYYFPAVRNWSEVEQILSQDLDLPRLLQRFGGSDANRDDVVPSVRIPAVTHREVESKATEPPVALPASRKPQTGKILAEAIGRGLQSARTRLQSRRESTLEPEDIDTTAAQEELTNLSQRLQEALELSEHERKQWRDALQPLLAPASAGFWSNEARLLYDLQKVCVEQERGVYRLDPIGWIRTLGKLRLRRPLPLMKDVLTLRHLRTVRRRMAVAHICAAEQDQLMALVDRVLPRIETRSRERLRRIIHDVFDRVDFIPGNVPEVVARRKLVEELVDRIIEHSYVTMADVRDAISKNDLKLPDVTTFSELFTGTCLLRADRQLDTALDGVYRRGAVYLRWPQTLSSVVFGTNFGRFVTQHLIVPFGGAYLLLAFVTHMFAMFAGHPEESPPSPANQLFSAGNDEPAASAPSQGAFGLSVLVLGLWLSMLIHRPDFRAWNIAILRRGWQFLRHVVFEVPSMVLNSPYVQRVLSSRPFALLRSYVLEPGLLAGLIYLFPLLRGDRWSGRAFFELFLVAALFLNSAVGRAIAERTIDFLVRAWQDLKLHFFAALVRGIMDLFDRIFTLLEQVVYTVDEWLRFRTGDNRATQAIKLAGSVGWFFVSYVVVFVFTLLVEPQVNPIKHFPVVTVAHKLILPTGPVFVASLTPYVGGAWAQTLVWTTIWLIPGVFGFLVWELRENWRLYAANRPQRLGSEAIGEHGETMIRLLRPGIHSGTLPKAYAALRRAIEKRGRREQNRIQRKRTAIVHVEMAVRHFVERELITLLEVAQVVPEGDVEVSRVDAATNRIDVEVVRTDRPDLPMRLTWEYHRGELVGAVDPIGWMQTVDDAERRSLSVALEGLFQRSGVERVRGGLPLNVAPAMTWQESVSFWSGRNTPAELLVSVDSH